MDAAWIGVCGTIGGTLIGSGITWLSSKSSAKREREHQKRELILQRREAAAVTLSAELEQLEDALPPTGTPSADQVPRLQEATDLLRRCVKRAQMIEDASITHRLQALDYALWVAVDEAEEKEGAGSLNIWSLGLAVEDLNAAVVAFQLRKEPPPARFPPVEELRALVGVDPGGMKKINRAARLSRLGQGKDPN